MASKGLLLDSSFLVAFLYQDDPLHARAQEVAMQCLVNAEAIYTTNLIFIEYATVLAMRVGRKGLQEALNKDALLQGGLEELFVTEELYNEVRRLYLRQDLHKDISFVDLSSALLAKKMSLDILSFDKHFKVLGQKYGFKVLP